MKFQFAALAALVAATPLAHAAPVTVANSVYVEREVSIGNGSVSRIDPGSNKVSATITIGDAVADGEIAAGLGSVWVSAPGVPIVRIDPANNRAVQRFTGEGGGAVLAAHGSLWVAAGAQSTWRQDPLLIASLRP